MVWAEFVDLIYAGLVCVSTAFGGSMGWAIAVVSLAVRVLLLPLTLHMAYRGLETQAALRRLEPELTRIRAKYKKDQRRVLEETARLYREHGVKLADGRSLFSAIVQLPIFLGLFGAISRGLGEGGRFLWVRNIAVPDLPLAAICAGVTALSASLAPHVPAVPTRPDGRPSSSADALRPLSARCWSEHLYRSSGVGWRGPGSARSAQGSAAVVGVKQRESTAPA